MLPLWKMPNRYEFVALRAPEAGASDYSCHNPKQRPAAGLVSTVFDSQCSPVGFCDLATEHQSDSATSGLGGKEGNKKVGGIGQTGTFIQYFDFQIASIERPADAHFTVRFGYCINCVFDQVN